jgi:hypothetical protein
VPSSREPDQRIELVRRRYELDLDPTRWRCFGSDEVAELFA